MHPAKTQISLGIRPVWSESSLFAWRKLRSLATHWATAKTDQTGRMPRLIWVFAGRTHFFGFVMLRLKLSSPQEPKIVSILFKIIEKGILFRAMNFLINTHVWENLSFIEIP